jgi:hypothetical protein
MADSFAHRTHEQSGKDPAKLQLPETWRTKTIELAVPHQPNAPHRLAERCTEAMDRSRPLR